MQITIETTLVCFTVIYTMYGIGYASAAADSAWTAVLMCLFWPFFKGFADGWATR